MPDDTLDLLRKVAEDAADLISCNCTYNPPPTRAERCDGSCTRGMALRALAQLAAAPPPTTLDVLILHSQDGADWTHAILYPSTWTPEHADAQAVEAFAAAQAENPDEWSWDDYEPELLKRGFVIPCWHHGPTWDEEHDAIKQRTANASIPNDKRD